MQQRFRCRGCTLCSSTACSPTCTQLLHYILQRQRPSVKQLYAEHHPMLLLQLQKGFTRAFGRGIRDKGWLCDEAAAARRYIYLYIYYYLYIWRPRRPLPPFRCMAGIARFMPQAYLRGQTCFVDSSGSSCAAVLRRHQYYLRDCAWQFYDQSQPHAAAQSCPKARNTAAAHLSHWF